MIYLSKGGGAVPIRTIRGSAPGGPLSGEGVQLNGKWGRSTSVMISNLWENIQNIFWNLFQGFWKETSVRPKYCFKMFSFLYFVHMRPSLNHSIIFITRPTWLKLIYLMHNTKTMICQIYDPLTIRVCGRGSMSGEGYSKMVNEEDQHLYYL